jgi:hypothetical protein
MIFTLSLDLPASCSYAELRRHIDRIAHEIPDDPNSRPDAHEVAIRLNSFVPGVADVRGSWRFETLSIVQPIEQFDGGTAGNESEVRWTIGFCLLLASAIAALVLGSIFKLYKI